jgi:hypothetical protein
VLFGDQRDMQMDRMAGDAELTSQTWDRFFMKFSKDNIM